MNRILLLEDDTSLGATLCERLGHKGYRVSWATSLQDARTLFAEQNFDLAILDVGLPDGSGFEFAAEISANVTTPFVFLTAQSSAQERLKGFELGACEFIPKPFSFKELLLRVRHVFNDHRRPPATIACADRVINLDDMSVSDKNGKITFLSNRDFKLLAMLISQAPRPVSRDEILDELCGQDQFPSNRTIDNSIVRLRQILGETAGQSIRSIRSVGYQWAPEEEKQS